MYLINGFWHHSRVLFTGNTVKCNKAQGLTLVGSVLELDGTNHIYDNRDHYGGGIPMHGNSQLWIRNGSTLNVSDNHAFVRDDDGGEVSNCTAWEELAVYPGQTIILSVKLIGDMGISLENVMYIQLETSRFANDSKVYVPLLLHSTHVLNHGCNTLTLPPLPSKDDHNWVLQLMVPLLPDRNQNIFLFEYVETKTLDCPIAYHLVETNHSASCTCYKLLKKKVKCLLEIQQFTLPKH